MSSEQSRCPKCGSDKRNVLLQACLGGNDTEPNSHPWHSGVEAKPAPTCPTCAKYGPLATGQCIDPLHAGSAGESSTTPAAPEEIYCIVHKGPRGKCLQMSNCVYGPWPAGVSSVTQSADQFYGNNRKEWHATLGAIGVR